MAWYSPILSAYVALANGKTGPFVPIGAFADSVRSLIAESDQTALLRESIVPVAGDGKSLAASGKAAAFVLWTNVYTREGSHSHPANRNVAALAKLREASKRTEVKVRNEDSAKIALAAFVDAFGNPSAAVKAQRAASRMAGKAGKAATASPKLATVAERLAAGQPSIPANVGAPAPSQAPTS